MSVDGAVTEKANAELDDGESRRHARVTSPSRWPPPMDRAAFHGLAGDFARWIEPRTESDPAAILVQTLVAFGALVGRGPHVRVEGDEHHAALFALLVGSTGRGRKGTSWSRVRQVFESIGDWKPGVTGLSSGEGLKYAVRDAREETKTLPSGDQVTHIVDAGVTDKRLLVIEPEFGNVLRVGQRHGSTLSATIREAWDSGELRTLTKCDPITATGAHISIVGHITDVELRAELTTTDTANGFANRFLFVAVRRSKLLPFGGGPVDGRELDAFAARFAACAEIARTRGPLAMTSQARTVWRTVYPRLSEGGGGLYGAATARAEAQCLRLALVYALLDGSSEINHFHLGAALSVWDFCDRSARFVFGTTLGNSTADEIQRRLDLAGTRGMSRTEIRDVFKRHLSAEKIGFALDLLLQRGRVVCEMVDTAGRPCEVWRAAHSVSGSDECDQSDKRELMSLTALEIGQ